MEFRTIHVQDREGRPVSGASVYVYLVNTLTEATIYDESGGALSQPILTNTSGDVGFRAANGEYDVVSSRNGAIVTVQNVRLLDADEFLADAETARDAAVDAKDLAETAASSASASATAAESSASRVDLGALDDAVADAESAQGFAETAQAGAETAQTAAETAQAGAEAAQTAAETAQGLAEAARDTALSVSVTGSSAVAGGPVAVATTANITLSGEQTIDGVLTSTSRVLVKDQTAPAENGIYVSAAGAWSRATDMDDASEVEDKHVFVTGGSANSGRTFATYSAVSTLGTDPIVWVLAQDETAALAAKADAASPTLTGSVDMSGATSVTVPTPTTGTEATTKAYVDDAVAGVSIDWLEFSQTIGLDGTPASSSAFVDATFAFAEVVTRNSTLDTLVFWAVATGTVTVRRFARSGNDFSQVGTDLDIVVSSTGLNSLTGGGVDFAAFEVLEGECLGFYGPGVLGRINATGPAFYQGSGGDETSFTDSASATNIQIQLKFGLGARETDLIRDEVDALDARVTDAEVTTDAIREVRVIGRDGAFSDASPPALVTPFIFGEPVVFAGTVSAVPVYANDVGTIPLKVFRRVGASYVQVGSDYTITVSEPGFHLFTSADWTGGTISVQPGDFLGFFNDGNVVAFANVSGHDEYYLWDTAAPGNVSTLTPNSRANSKQFQIGFTITPSAPLAAGQTGNVATADTFAVEAGASGTITGHLAYGQSWMDANGNNGALTAFQGPLYPLRIVTLDDGNGPQGWGGAARTASIGLTPLSEENPNVQTPIGAMGVRMARNMQLRGSSGAMFFRSEAHGGRSLAQLMPSDDPDYTGTSAAYTNLIAAVTEFVTHATSLGLSAEIATVSWCQGAADSGTAYATYKTLFERLISEIQTDIQAATGQTSGPTILIVQPPGTDTSGNWPCLQAQVDVAAERDDVVLVCAGWAIPQHDTTHFDTEGAVQVGELMASAAEAVAIGQPWSDPYLRDVTRNGTTITAYVGGPHGVLVDETVATTNHQVSSAYVANYGFEYSGANITAVVVEPRKITITLDADASGTLAYAYHATSRGDGASVNRGTIRADYRAKSAFVDRGNNLWLASGYWSL